MITMFEGFTEDEINRVANMVSVNSDLPNPTLRYKQGNFGSVNRRVLRPNRKNETYRSILSSTDSKLPAPKEEEEYEEENMEASTQQKGSVEVEKKKSLIEPLKQETPEEDKKEVNLTEVPHILTSQSLIQQPLTAKSDNPIIKHPPIDLEDCPSLRTLSEFEETRKKLEAFNLQRKEQLRQALTDRAKKTNEEVKKINQIEEELKKLDSSLSNDVCILRNQIELASHEFMEAQKRFNKAEKDYVEAKIELYSKKERKELLTSHLCSIIEQNELRKAKKLSDLMEKLESPSKPVIIAGKVESGKDSETDLEKNVS